MRLRGRGRTEEAVAGSEERAELEDHARLGYRPELDGARALAILPVVFFHAYADPEGGFLGVDIFFVLSGFLITTLLVQEWRGSGRISLGHFYFRRALRLLPALFAALAVYVAWTAATSLTGKTHSIGKLEHALESSAYGALYVINILLTIGSPYVAVPVRHLWSLATEEQFYLVWPLALLLALRMGARLRGLSVGLAAAIAILFAHRLELDLTGASHPRLYFAPDSHFDVLLVGCLAGVWFAYGYVPRVLQSRTFVAVATALALAGVTVMFVFTNIESRALSRGLLTAFAVAIGFLVLAVVLYRDSLLAAVLRLPPLVFVGKISYALYLWHGLILAGFAKWPVTAEVALSFAAATASYYIVELPFLRLKRRDRALVDRSATGTAAAPDAPAVAG